MNKPLCLALFLSSLAYGETPILQFKPEGELADGTAADIPGVIGANTKVFKQGFNPKASNAEPIPVQKVEILKEPSMDGGYFLRVTRDPAAQICGLVLTPVTTANSMAALSPLGADGVPRPSGTVDAFVRCNALTKAGDLSLFDHGQHGGLRLSIGSGNPLQGMVATLQALSLEKHVDTDFDGTADAVQISAVSKDHPLRADTIYHVAAAFETDAEGITTLRLYQKEGTGPIDTTQNTNLAAQARGRFVGKFEGGFPETPIRFGIFGPGKKDFLAVQDFGALRIYQGIPTVLPGLRD